MKSGLREWQAQRASALLLSVFALPVLWLWFGKYLVHDHQWYDYLSSPYGIGSTICGLIGFAIHGYIGVKVVITDYIPRKWQDSFIFLAKIWTFILLLWGFHLMWALK